MKYANSLLELIGNTPLVRLHRTVGETRSLVLAKVEYLNPGGSVKDRIAIRMVDAAEASGELKPGGTIVEPTSGNTGVGLALVAQQRGYHCIFVCPDKVSEDKRNVLKAYGAEVVVCPTAVAPEHPDSYYSTSDRLMRETEGAWKPNQYANVNNPLSHYETTGPEIWEQTDGKITHFVTGMGTGGTISGVGRYLKEPNGGRPGGRSRPGRLGLLGRQRASLPGRGRGGGLLAGDLRPRHRRPDHRGLRRRLVRDVAPAGPGGGPAGRRLLRHGRPRGDPAGPGARRPRRARVIVVLLPDSGRGYLTKVFDDDWLAQYGFLSDAGAGLSIGEVLRAKKGDIPALVHTHPNETIAEAVHILQEYGVSQMPVVLAEPPIMAAEVAGSVSERRLLEALFAGNARLVDPVELHMDEPLPTVGAGAGVDEAVEALREADALLVQEDGKPIGVLTRQDLLGFVGRE